MTTQLLGTVVDALVQLVVLGILGGGVAWLYARFQRNRELRLQVLREFAALHGRFLALRYRFNSFHIEWSERRRAEHQPLDENQLREEKWRCFQEACVLLGEFQGLKPLISESFPEVAEHLAVLHSRYHDWRRRTGGDRPILQELDGKNEEGYKELRLAYQQAIHAMRRSI